MESLFRVYEPFELGYDGYPFVWHTFDAGDGVKHMVRAKAGDRCERCRHPYVPGAGVWGTDQAKGYTVNSEPPPSRLVEIIERDDYDRVELQMKMRPPLWSPCDTLCSHKGPTRWRANGDTPWVQGGVEVAGDIASFDHEVQASWRILTVHHLNGRKHDLRWWNLAALCQRCHLEIQHKVVMERVYPFEHTPWFQPHAAGFYAYAYLGEDLNFTDTMNRLDELLALERMA